MFASAACCWHEVCLVHLRQLWLCIHDILPGSTATADAVTAALADAVTAALADKLLPRRPLTVLLLMLLMLLLLRSC